MRPHELVLKAKYWHGDGICKSHNEEFPLSVWEVDTDKSTWFGTKVRELGRYGRRRFENWIILEHPRERIKVKYHYE